MGIFDFCSFNCCCVRGWLYYSQDEYSNLFCILYQQDPKCLAQAQISYGRTVAQEFYYEILCMYFLFLFLQFLCLLIMIKEYLKRTKWNAAHKLAKGVAGLHFVSALLLTILAPLCWFSLLCIENICSEFPVSEHSDVVGAWGPWDGTGLVLVAALVAKYHYTWFEYVSVLAGTVVTKFIKRGRTSNHPSHQFKVAKPQISSMTRDFFSIIFSPFVHGWFSTRYTLLCYKNCKTF